MLRINQFIVCLIAFTFGSFCLLEWNKPVLRPGVFSNLILDAYLTPSTSFAPKNESEMVSELGEEMPHFPVEFLYENRDKINGTNCTKLPNPWNIHVNDRYWQEVAMNDSTFYVWSAYLDTRYERKGPAVRAVGKVLMKKGNTIANGLKCHLWFEGENEPFITRVIRFQRVFNGGLSHDFPQPYIVSCDVLPLSFKNKTPAAVSFVFGDSCGKTATNAVKIQYNPLEAGETRKRQFGVCLKALNYPNVDLSKRLIEWLEVVRALGGAKVFVYILSVHPNIRKVLDYYSESGFVDVIETTLGGHEGDLAYYQTLYLKHNWWPNCWNEKISLNDCLYSNMYRYEFLAPLDLDELIVPLKRDNWSDLMKDLPDGNACYNFRNVYFLDDFEVDESVPEFGHIMRHVTRSEGHTPPMRFVKSFQRTDSIAAMHNHIHRGCRPGHKGCGNYSVNVTMGQLQHYRGDCNPGMVRTGSCKKYYRAKTTRDENMWRFKDKVLPAVKNVIANIGL